VLFALSWSSDSLVFAVVERCAVETLFNNNPIKTDHEAGPYHSNSRGEPKYTDTYSQNGERCADSGVLPKTNLDVLCACPLHHDQIGH
jgi:hypothetical protein